MKRAVLFDIDGTLLDAWNFVMDAVKYTTAFYQLPTPKEELLLAARGMPLLEFYQTVFPGKDAQMLSKTHNDFQKDGFEAHKLFPKAKMVLRDLKNRGFLLAAVSNRTRISLQTSLDLVGISQFFDLVLSAEDVKNPKPHKDHLLTALKHFKVNPKQAFMIGDTQFDILAGKSAGVKTIAVTYGFLGPDIKNTNPDFVVERLEELLAILQ